MLTNKAMIPNGGLASFVVLAVLLLVGCGGTKQDTATTAQPEASSAPAAQPADQTASYAVAELPGGIVEGRILFQGAAPAPKKVQVTQDGDVCGKVREVQTVQLKDGGLDNAVVWIDDIQKGKAFAFAPAQVEQQKCAYVPHVVLMQPGDLKIVSNDPIPHNVHSYAQDNREFNESMNALRKEISISFKRPDIVSLRCDLHGWMQAYIVVAKNPYYAVTSNGGRFRLEGVPPGQYRLKLWTESQGQSDQQIVVEVGKTTQVDFKLPSAGTQTAKATLQ